MPTAETLNHRGLYLWLSLFLWAGASYGVARLDSISYSTRWILVALLMIALLVALGALIAGRYAGALIDDRGFMSLSRFQLILWTILLLSGFIVMGIARARAPEIADPLELRMSDHLWLLLGIHSAALAGTPLIHSAKESKTPADPTGALNGALLRTGVASASLRGLLFAKAAPKDASVSDLFTGEEAGDAGRLDMAKVQMFVFTAVGALVYGLALYRAMSTKDASALAFPDPTPGLIAILGISNAAHLAGKLPDKSRVADPAKSP